MDDIQIFKDTWREGYLVGVMDDIQKFKDTWREGDLGGVMDDIQKFKELRLVSVISRFWNTGCLNKHGNLETIWNSSLVLVRASKIKCTSHNKNHVEEYKWINISWKWMLLEMLNLS